MSEPISGGVAGAAGWKLIGGAAGALGIAAALSALVVMCMTLPKTAREWAVGLTSTFIFSFAGGAYAAVRLGLQHELVAATDDFTLFLLFAQVIGYAFAAGLPGWAIVRWVFRFIERRADSDIAEIAEEARKIIIKG